MYEFSNETMKANTLVSVVNVEVSIQVTNTLAIKRDHHDNQFRTRNAQEVARLHGACQSHRLTAGFQPAQI